MNIPNLEPYVIKILTHNEKEKISELIRTNDSLTHKYEYIEPKKIFNIQIILNHLLFFFIHTISFQFLVNVKINVIKKYIN